MADLVEMTGVAAMTVRRDLDELEARGALRRVHGGAVAAGLRGEHLPYAVRLDSFAAEKVAIARAAAALVPEGASVIVDNGSTCTAVARELAGRDLTVLAMSVHVAAALGQRPGTRILTPGGALDPGELAWVGAGALEALRDFRADLAILGVCAWDLESGVVSTAPGDVALKRAIVASARRTVAVATPDKFARPATFAVCPNAAVDAVVTTRRTEALERAFDPDGPDVVEAA